MLNNASAAEVLKDRATSANTDQPPSLPQTTDTESPDTDHGKFEFSDASPTGRRAAKPAKTTKPISNTAPSSRSKTPSGAHKKAAPKRSAKKTNPNAMMWGTFFSLLLLIIVGGGSAYLAKQYFAGEDGRLSPNATTKFEGEGQEQSFAELAKSMGKSTTLTNDTTKQAKAPAPATEVITIKIPGEKTARKIQMRDLQTFTATVRKVMKSQRGNTRYIYFSDDEKSNRPLKTE
jgi:hypothetical protein